MSSTISQRAAVDPSHRRARVAVSLLFFTNGAIPGNLIPRIPSIKSALEISNGELGLAVAAGPVGALVSGLLAGMLIRRFRSSRVAVAGMILASLAVIFAGVAPSLAMFAAAFFIMGALDSVVDVAQNSHGLRVQRFYGRSILNSFHAIWSIGAVTGGLMASAAVSLSLPLNLHLPISAIIFSAINLIAYQHLLPGPEPDESTELADGATTYGQQTPSRGRFGMYAALLALGVIAVGGSFVEDAGNTWATLYLNESLHAVPQIAAFGFISVTGMQFVGRITGDRLVDRFGQRAVARTGGAITAIGMGLALAFPTVLGTIIGFGAAGFGIATLVPAAMGTADQLPGLRPGTGLTILTWMMRVGFLISPPIVGMIADVSSLRLGLVMVPAAGLLVVLLAGVLPRRLELSTASKGPDAKATTQLPGQD